MKKCKIFSYIFTIAITLSLTQCVNNQKELHKELIRRAADLNMSTPVALEVHTRFDSVGVSPSNVFQYYYTITNIENPGELLSSKKNEIIESMDKLYSEDPSLKFFIKNEVKMEYIYRDTAMNVIDVITIETSKYKK